MQFICRTSANDGGTELCVQVKKHKFPNREDWHVLLISRRIIVCEARFPSWLLQCESGSRVSDLFQCGSGQASPGTGLGEGMGQQEWSLGEGGNSLCFTDMNIQNLNSSVPACLFPELSIWLVSPELGSCCSKPELTRAGSESGVPGCSVPRPLAPSELKISSTMFIGHMGQLCPNPLPGAHYIAPTSTLIAGHY